MTRRKRRLPARPASLAEMAQSIRRAGTVIIMADRADLRDFHKSELQLALANVAGVA